MSQIRDNSAATQVPVSADVSGGQLVGQNAEVLPFQTQAQADKRHNELEQDRQNQQKNMQADFAKQSADPPGYGANENADSQLLKKAMTQQGMPVPSAEQAQSIYAAVGNSKEFKAAEKVVQDALNGDGPVPSSEEMEKLLGDIVNSDVFPKAKKDAGVSRYDTSNATALVMLVILSAQQENTKEKNDVLGNIKMYNLMTQELNKLVENTLIPAQQKIQNLIEKGKDQKDFKADQVMVPIVFPSHIDPNNALQDPKTGGVKLIMQWGDGQSSSRQMVNSTGLSTLISQADQTRTSIQNNSTQQSNRFQAKDNQMSSAWNILNAVFKNSHDGVVNIVRNV